MAAEDLVWLVWSCEDHDFESHLPREEARHRLAELTLDDTVTGAHIADDPTTQKDARMTTVTAARATTRLTFTAKVGMKAWMDRYDLEASEVAGKIEQEVRHLLDNMYVVDSALTRLDVAFSLTGQTARINLTASTKIDSWGGEYGISPTAVADDVYDYFNSWLRGMCSQFNEIGHDVFLSDPRVRRA